MGEDQGSVRRGLPTRALSQVASLAPKSKLHVAAGLLNTRFEPEMRKIVSRCDPNGVAIDVGAWYGPWTYWLSKRVLNVHSFEPNPRVAEILRKGVASNVLVHECAASDVAGTADLVLQKLGLGSEGTASIVPGVEGLASYSVKTQRIDDMNFTDVRFIKIDVEGHERAVLDGAMTTITTYYPVLFVELEERMTNLDATVGLLTNIGYEARFFMDHKWISATEFDLAQWQRDYRSSHGSRSYLQTLLRGDGYVNDVPKSTWSPWD